MIERKKKNQSKARRGTKANRDGFDSRTLMQVLMTLRRSQNSRDLPGDQAQLFAFFQFATAHLEQSHSQLFQDLWVLFECERKREGFFVEFGATDGRQLSNSLLLERDYGWRGILAEPNPEFHQALFANRGCHISTKCVFSQSGLTERFACAPDGEFSRMERIVPEDSHEAKGRRQTVHFAEVETITLNDLLDAFDAPEEIDYLSIDTEGSELEILKAYDFSKRRIRLISVEHNSTPLRDELLDLLTQQGYQRRWPRFTSFDDWYVLTDASR